ncbi:MAG: hypothetical protein V9G04_05195 [Nocardioides sp.]
MLDLSRLLCCSAEKPSISDRSAGGDVLARDSFVLGNDNTETSQSMWAMLRRRRGLPARIARAYGDLIPWPVKFEHRWE